MTLKKKNVLKKTGIIALSTAVAVGAGVGFDHFNEKSSAAENKDKTESAIEKTYPNLFKTKDSNENSKDETVYALLGSDGSQKKVTANEWLKNGKGKKTISDKSTLTNIENTSGDEKYEQDGKNLTWKAGGKDIKYTGEFSGDLPVEVQVAYYLDGQEVPADEIAGKSGSVEIRFDYTVTKDTKVSANGNTYNMTQPYTVASGVLLDTDKFSDISVSNGKTMIEGDNAVCVGIAFPGLGEDLSLSSNKINIPDSVTIKAETTDFEIDGTYTIAMTGVLKDLDTSGADTIQSQITKLESSMNQLSSASDQLVSGSEALAEGTGSLVSGVDELYSGSGKLNDGTVSLYNGTISLKNGAGQLNSGAISLADGTGTLAGGAKKLSGGAGDLADGTKKLSNGAGDLADGTKKLSKGAGDLADGTKKLSNGSGDLASGAKKLSSGASDLADGTSKLNDGVKSASKLKSGVTDLYNGSKKLNNSTADSSDLAKGAKKLNSSAKTLNSSLQKIVGDSNANSKSVRSGTAYFVKNSYAKLVDDNKTSVNGLITQLYSVTSNDFFKDRELKEDISDNSTNQTTLKTVISTLESNDAMASTYADTIKKLKTLKEGLQQHVDAISSIDQYTEGVDSVAAGVKGNGTSSSPGLVVGTQSLIDGIKKLHDEGTNPLYKGLKTLLSKMSLLQKLIDGVSDVNDGAQQVSKGASDLSSGADKLDKGVSDVNTGAKSLSSGASALNTGAKSLSSGASELNTGAQSLSSGASELSTGAGKLNKGAKTLKNGTGSLYDGTKTLSNGALALKDGMGTLYSGIGTLDAGAGTLNSGAEELAAGMKKFDQTGIKVLVNTLSAADLANTTSRLTAVAEAAQKNVFVGGKRADMDGQSKIIFKTEEVKK